MKILLFGGAFDPPHLGHHSITKNILDQGIADQIWYVPTKTHPFEKEMSSIEHRSAMLEFLISADNRMKIETHEMDKSGVGYSHETLDELSKKYPEHEFSWLIGSDNLPKFHLWSDSKARDFKEMLSKYLFYVYPRKDFGFSPIYENMIPLESMDEIEVSSTLVKEKLKKGESVDDLVMDEIIKYIDKNNLYK